MEHTTNRVFEKTASAGFTLVELVLYVGIAGIMLFVLSIFLSTLLESRVKNTTIAEVDQQGLQLMQAVTQTIRNAQNIISPAQGISTSSLVLDVPDAAKDPTIFNLSGGAARVTEGAGSSTILTNSRVVVSTLTFRNLSRAGTPGTVRVQFTLTHINPGGRNEYNYQKTFIGSATLYHP